MARGALPDSHPLCLGMPGMHGNYTAITACKSATCWSALGARFDDRVTGKLDGFAPHAKIIHVDIDPAEMGKVRRPDCGIVGDVRVVMEQLIQALAPTSADACTARPKRMERHHCAIGSAISRFATAPHEEGEPLKPQNVVEMIRN